MRKAVLKSARKNIPAGYRKDFVPNLPPEAVRVRDRRDALRAANPRDPEIVVLEKEIRDICNKAAHEEFNEELEKTDYQENSSKFVNLVRRLSGRRVHRPPNQPISFSGKTKTKRAAIVKNWNKQFSSIGPHSHLRVTRRVLRKIRKKKLVSDFKPFSEEDTLNAIGRAKASTAAGPDEITMVHLKHFGPLAIRFLTHLFNLSVARSEIPSIWKKATIIPVPKKTRPTELKRLQARCIDLCGHEVF